MQIMAQQNHQLAKLITALGENSFFAELLDYFNQLCPVEHLSVFIFNHQLVPQLAGSCSLAGDSLAQKIGQLYTRKSFYLQDPNSAQVQNAPSQTQDISVMRMRASDIRQAEYKATIYDQFNLIDRLSFLSQFNNHWYIVNLYREVENGEFSSEEMQLLQQYAEFIVAISCKHFTLLPPSVWKAPSLPEPEMLQTLLQQLDAGLSQREIEVCSYGLLGITSDGIALTLGVQPNTVATLRKRAFGKLNISSMTQLYGLCLGQIIEQKYLYSDSSGN